MCKNVIMDCYILKSRFFNCSKAYIYKEVLLSCVLKNFKINDKKYQVAIIEFGFLSSCSKMLCVKDKGRLIRLIRDNLYNIYVRNLTFTQLNTYIRTRVPIEVINIKKKLKISLKPEEVDSLLKEFTKGVSLKHDCIRCGDYYGERISIVGIDYLYSKKLKDLRRNTYDFYCYDI